MSSEQPELLDPALAVEKMDADRLTMEQFLANARLSFSPQGAAFSTDLGEPVMGVRRAFMASLLSSALTITGAGVSSE